MTTRRVAAIRTSLPAALASLLTGLLVAGLLVAGSFPASAAGGPRLSVGDARILERDDGYVYLAFTVRLARATGRPVTVRYATSNGTATAPADYGPAKGEVSFRGTTVTKKVHVPVFGDTVLEPDETFRLTLSQPVGASLGARTGVGTIRNDEPATLTVDKAGTGAGTVTSNPTGIDCGADCTHDYAYGTPVTLTATPDGVSEFAGWSGASCDGPTCSVTMDQAVNVTATFMLQSRSLTVTKAGTGTGTVTSDPSGISCGLVCTENYAHGTQVELTASPDAGSVFTGWSGGGCSGTGTCEVIMTEGAVVTATFTPTWTLSVAKGGNGNGSVSSTGPGINCGSDCTESYVDGTTVTLTASSAFGSNFMGWTGPCSGAGMSCTITMTEDTTVTATFALQTHTLTVNKNGSGTVTGNGINCGVDCTESYNHGTMVTLTASPAPGSTFTGWTGGCFGTGPCTITMTQAVNVTATFTVQSHTLTVTKDGDGTGTVTGNGINCGVDCTESYPHGTTVTLTANASPGSIFDGWSGACTGVGTCTVSMTAARTVTATFSPFSSS